MTDSTTFAGEFNDRRATCGGVTAIAWRMENGSIGQVVILNSGRRRRALVSSWDCIRLESATRTLMAFDVAARDELIVAISHKTRL
jgi:hypothetical protein